MNFWHLQMHLPEGREGRTVISPLAMLQEPVPVIGTGDWDNIQCRHFKGEEDGLHIGSIVMVREGNKPLALVEVISDYFSDEELEEKYVNVLFRKVKVLDFNTDNITSNLFTQRTLKKLYANSATESWKFINKWYQKVTNSVNINDVLTLLQYKKQIILQGPPGTGKTRMAKEIAAKICDLTVITENDIRLVLSTGLKINSADNYTQYTITEIGANNVSVQLTNSNSFYKPSFKEIINAFDIKMWEGKQKGGNDSYSAAIAKYIYNNHTLQNEIKVVQFHPSYSYEDFVRGIVAETKDGAIEYKSINKILGRLAQEALLNWNDSKKSTASISKEKKVKQYFESFADEIRGELEGGTPLMLTDSVGLVDVEDDAFRYKGKEGWTVLGNRMSFTDIIRAFLDNNNTRQDIKRNGNISGLAKQHASYYVRVLAMFREYLQKNNLGFENLSEEKVYLKNYVLIIDEINKANLSSVLGELIYALEYRGEPVESIYEVEQTTLTLPPNLFIIGTMNTADRSVGHIDYAIRRRFAFVDIPPKDLSDDKTIVFARQLFSEVEALFSHDTHLSPEFDPKDVKLGHSYFIDKTNEGGPVSVRLEYEIKPILREYIKDGILVGDGIKAKIEQLKA